MKLNNFITMEKPWAYNFEFECGDEDYINLKTPLMRYFIYKMQPDVPAWWLDKVAYFIKNNFGYRPVYDPDGSDERAFYKIVIEIYNHLWSWNCPAEPDQRKVKYAEIDGNIFGNCFFGPDTMNSVQKPLSLFCGVENYSLRRTINKCYDPNMNAVNININGLVSYINWYHTLGNFVLVPEKFNEYRSDEFEDFWDLSLANLKEGFNEKNSSYSRKYKKECYYDKKDENGNVIVVFDKSMFNKYINFFFLWDYVEYKDNGYIVRHISYKDCGSEQLSPDFFIKTREIIEHRGRFMTAMLMLEQDNPVLYKDIQGWLVVKSDSGELSFPFFDGMNDAAGKIMEKFGEKISENAKGILKGFSAYVHTGF